MKYKFIDNYAEEKNFVEASKILFSKEIIYERESKTDNSVAEIKKVG